MFIALLSAVVFTSAHQRLKHFGDVYNMYTSIVACERFNWKPAIHFRATSIGSTAIDANMSLSPCRHQRDGRTPVSVSDLDVLAASSTTQDACFHVAVVLVDLQLTSSNRVIEK
jgi:hypothetical protein